MLSPTFVNINSYFYPIGNTPAVSLTQAMPPHVPSDILLLGCGDLRNILHTCHIDDRLMDITCCDNQKEVIARNILLLTLILDGHDQDRSIDSLWSIYYHLYLDKDALTLLQSQCRKLCKLSTTMQTWRQGQYGLQLRFCDFATLADVRKMWEHYSVEHKGVNASNYQRRLKVAMQQAENEKGKGLGSNVGMILTGFRSAAPAHVKALEDLDGLHKHYWKYGSTELDMNVRTRAKHPNPTFLTLEDQANLHYGIDPFLGFHLATAYMPRDPKSLPSKQLKGLSQPERVIAAARAEFTEWATSYRTHDKSITIRFNIGEATSFAHTLQHKHITQADTAYRYQDQFHFRPLVLDGPDYKSGIAPTSFDVIDTSNLCDHLGPLVLLTATSPLLRNHMSSALYTEVLVKRHKSHKDILDNLLCGHVPTLSTLFGLFPVDYWTNTSCLSTGDERILDIAGGSADKSGGTLMSHLDSQMFLRVCWRRPMCMDGPSGPCLGLMKIQFDAKQLARVLFEVYIHIFKEEDLGVKFADTSIEAIQKSALVWYHRASFASFLRLVKSRVTCEWDKAMHYLIELIGSRPNAPMGIQYVQELFIYLHMLDVFSSEMLQNWHDRDNVGSSLNSPFVPIASRVTPVDEEWGDLRDWKNIPPVVCVTLKVPRKNLAVFTEMDRSKLGSPSVHCLLQDAPSAGENPWQNIFAACHIAFGNLSSSGRPHHDSFQMSVAEDDLGWRGTSPLIVAFYVPSFFLLLQPQRGMVAFGVHSSPATAMSFVPKLGSSLNVYETTLDNSNNVFITRHSPSQTGFPIAPGFAQTELVATETINPDADASLIAGVDEQSGCIVNLTSRLDIRSDDYNSMLRSGYQVQTSLLSPCQVLVTIGTTSPLILNYPVIIVGNTHRTRIARKSSYMEVIAQVAASTAWMKHPHFMYPVFLQGGLPINWNMPGLNLRSCPVIDVEQRKKLDWLNTHVSLATSARERALREGKQSPSCSGEQIRLDFKESLFTLFIQFAGVQGDRHRVFGLNNVANGGNQILILPSTLRIDLANRSVVLDCAVLPFYTELMPRLRRFLSALSSQGLSQIKVNDPELRLWKQALPAYIERCRTWNHRADCEYTKTRAVPITVEDEKVFLCSCGNGIFPSNFINTVPYWNDVSKHAVRIAISPAFWAPYADEVYRPDISEVLSPASNPQDDKCGNCGAAKKKDGSILFRCGRCQNVRYCSRECQVADWKAHKKTCNRGGVGGSA